MKHYYNILLSVIILFIHSSVISAQLQRSSSFKEEYKLKEVVVLSRHNIRSPLSSNNSTLGRLTPHSWIEWTSNTSELTLRGGVLETIMGQFFRKWLINEGLFLENHDPDADEVYIYANSMQRTIATARYFASGFMPLANLTVSHRMAHSKMDPVFCPQLTKVNDNFRQEALRQISAMYGKKDIVSITDTLKEAYKILSSVLDLNESAAYKTGEFSSFNKNDLQVVLQKNKEPQMKGALKLATSAADALVLQYYEEADNMKAAFGHSISLKDWEKIAMIKDVYGDILFSAPIVACNVAHPLLVYLNDELSFSNRKFTFLCGHDSNIASVNAALEVENYELPNSIEKKTPIGCKLVFEKWINKENKEFIAINMVYQSTHQLRDLQLLDLHNPPMVYPLKLRNMQLNKDGLYPADDVQNRFSKAIHTYENIK